MNVFEDLIEELKEEKLLEDTVFSVSDHAVMMETSVEEQNVLTIIPNDVIDDPPTSFAKETGDYPADDSENEDVLEIKKPINGFEFYRKRAMEDVSSLQMVEHVLSGVEREHLKSVPVAYDDFKVKKALHKFLQVGDDDRDESASCEKALLHETQNWGSALVERDNKVSVANIRRFCENSRPVLSSQALLALARFYRNSPFSESVRGKFDFVITRLFSRDAGRNKRQLLFGRSDTIGHINTLYSNWLSILLYSNDDDSERIAYAVKRFSEFLGEVRDASQFDDLTAGNFFERIRLFKESCNELFFHPEVLAAALECNVGIGNRFVDLLESARETEKPEHLEEKYGLEYDQIVSDAASRTLHLLEILRGEQRIFNYSGTADSVESQHPDSTSKQTGKQKRNAKTEGIQKNNLFAVNKWLLAATILITAISGGIYFWAESVQERESATAVAAKVDMSESGVAGEIKDARSSGETMYAVAQQSWDLKSESEQQELLRKLLEFAAVKGLRKVQLLNEKGRSIGFVDKGRIEIIKPR